ncbi:MAG: DUF1905 domain-containing protein [Bacteroidota bacterium]
MEGKIQYAFTAKLWQHASPGGWFFVSLPQDYSEEIRGQLQWQEEGWGRMKARAQIGTLTWETAIWFDTKMETYLLPIKAEIRKKAKLEIDQSIEIIVWI